MFTKTKVQSKSEKAISIAKGAIDMFTLAVLDLGKSNKLAEETIFENTLEIDKREIENESMEETIANNETIAKNINTLLGKDEKTDDKV